MRFQWITAIIVLAALQGLSQGTSAIVPIEKNETAQRYAADAKPPEAPEPKLQHMRTMVRKEFEKAIDQSCPPLAQWQPLTSAQKFRIFLKRTGSPRTFAGAAVDAAADKWQNDNMEYARGYAGYFQHYGVEVAKGESDAFFQTFLLPTLLKQDPRYFRNPRLPFLNRTLYSLSRVLITRTDSGHETFNASYVLGGAASQALSDLYVPGHRQGLHPIADRLTFNLARDAAFNLLHEFWPDLRHKVLHR
jgi:hypothetical protein